MTLHLVGLGLDVGSISADALVIIRTCEQVYLESYTVDFPYSLEELESFLGCELAILDREGVEQETMLEEAKEEEIALLVYGDPLSATTHITIKKSCEEQGITCNVYHNASILTAIAETGLSLYKFGKTSSIPDWKEHTNKPTSFIQYVRENKTINAHSLLLCDIGLTSENALAQLKIAAEKEEVQLTELLIVSHAGTKKQTITKGTITELQKQTVPTPYCIIIPGELSHTETEALKKI